MSGDERDRDRTPEPKPEDGSESEPRSGSEPDAASVDATLEELFSVIESRKQRLPEGSYTASLFTHEKGENAVLEKLGEETAELLLAAKDDDREEMTHEAADVVYHMLVLLSMKGLTLEDLERELRDRS